MGLIFKNIANAISDIDTKTSTIKGYASVFGNVDSDNDIIVKGSYAKTVKDWGPQGKARVKHCWQHDITDPFLKNTELFEDNYGLAFVSTAPPELKDVKFVQDRIALIQSGLVDEISVGIIPIRADRKEGVRYITENKLFEYSSVTLASNELAKVTSVKGTSAAMDVVERLSKKSELIVSLLKNGNVSDDCFFMVEYYHEQLLKHISDLLAAPLDSTQQPAPDLSTQISLKKNNLSFQSLSKAIK